MEADSFADKLESKAQLDIHSNVFLENKLSLQMQGAVGKNG